jgi:hypothetical protein
MASEKRWQTWVVAQERYHSFAPADANHSLEAGVRAFRALGWTLARQASGILEVAFADLRDLQNVSGEVIQEVFRHFESSASVGRRRLELRHLVDRQARQGALMPDLGEAVQHLVVVGRVSIGVLQAELARGNESMTVEVADLSRPLARVWARYAAPDMATAVPLGRGSWAGPSVVVDTGRTLIRSTRTPARPFNHDSAGLQARLEAADAASERLVKALGA